MADDPDLNPATPIIKLDIKRDICAIFPRHGRRPVALSYSRRRAVVITQTRTTLV